MKRKTWNTYKSKSINVCDCWIVRCARKTVDECLIQYQRAIDKVLFKFADKLFVAVVNQCGSSTLTQTIKENTMKSTYFFMMLLSAILIASISFAGYHYDGHGCMMSTWDMTEMDSNQDQKSMA